MDLPYTVLDAAQAQIRVLVISPPTPGSSLRCAVKIVSLDCTPRFTALSYVWGDPAVRRKIVVDDIDVEVTKNLHDALQWFSQQSQLEMPIWADAICINQQDLDEKSTQISLMSRIYKTASKVMCWLGPSTPRIDKYLQRKASLARPISASGTKKAALWVRFLVKSWCRGKSTMAAVFECLEIVGGQTEFLQVGYFNRMWTFQESLIPEESKSIYVLDDVIRDFNPRKTDVVTCPSFVLAIMTDLVSQDPSKLNEIEAQAVAEFYNRTIALADSVLGKAVWRQMWLEERDSKEQQRVQLWEMLLATVDRLCQDPRDKVYALLGLMKERNSMFPVAGGEDLLAVDYTKAPEQVVLDALFYVYQSESPALVLFICTQYAPRREALDPMSAFPSWLPDVTTSRSTVYNRPKLAGKMLSDAAIKWSRAGGNTVTLSVRRVGQVVHICAFPSTTAGIINKAARMVQQCATPSPGNEYHDLISRLNTSGNLPQRLAHTFIGNEDKNMSLASAVATEALGFWEKLQQVVNGGSAAPEPRKYLDHAETVAMNLRGRALIVLGDGRFGLCAGTVEVGDEVFLAGAFRHCVVLRGAGGNYMFVDCVSMNALSAWSNLDKELIDTLSRTSLEEVIMV
ncbi:HET domain-containing protein [Microdochium nivale]|nr:HET domain-containing protein [Microdochium nivale]